MKKFAICVLMALAASWVGAAEGEWLTDFPKAQAQAKAENKMVFLDFTGSDWCPPCKALHKNVLTTKEFLDFAKDNLVLVELDFPRRKKLSPELQKANRALSEKYNVEAFPTIIVLDSKGKELSKDAGYGGESAKDFVGKLEKLKKK